MIEILGWTSSHGIQKACQGIIPTNFFKCYGFPPFVVGTGCMLFRQILYFTVDAWGLFPDRSSFQQIDDERVHCTTFALWTLMHRISRNWCTQIKYDHRLCKHTHQPSYKRCMEDPKNFSLQCNRFSAKLPRNKKVQRFFFLTQNKVYQSQISWVLTRTASCQLSSTKEKARMTLSANKFSSLLFNKEWRLSVW